MSLISGEGKFATDSTRMKPELGRFHTQSSDNPCKSVFIRGRLVQLGWWLHELDRRPIGIADIDDPFPGVRTRLERLRLARRLPTGFGNGV